MKILLVNNLYPPYARGGAESIVVAQANKFQQQGHDVHVFTTVPLSLRSSRKIMETTNEQGIIVHRYTPTNIASYYNLHRIPKPLRLLWHIIDTIDFSAYAIFSKLMRDISPDKIITHNLKGTGMPIVRAANKAPEHIHYLHDVQLITPSGLILHKQEKSWDVIGIFARWYQWMTRRAFKNTKTVHAPSQWVIDIHKEFGFFKNAQVHKQVQPQKNFNKEKIRPTRCLFVGQIENHKGIAFLLSVFAEVTKNREDLRLDVVGGGSQFKSLQKQYEDNDAILFHGKVQRSQLEQFYASADTLLVPSLCYENTPTVITEAHSHGLRVVASLIGGIPEMLLPNDIAIEPANRQMWKDALYKE